MKAFVFPGQGSQYVGMGKDLYRTFKIARTTFEEASDVTGVDLCRVCFEDRYGELTHTINAQPAIVTVSVAALRVISEETEIKADYVAGHSLGEYTALVASEAMDFKDAVWIVRKRGEYMQNAVPLGVGAMSAIIGLQKHEVEKICSEASVNGFIVTPANFNAPSQTVISGNKEAVDKATELARSNGAKRVIPLEVSAPFHCPLMAPAAEKLRMDLEKIDISRYKIPVVTNVDAKLNTDPVKTKATLVDQVKSPVQWYESIKLLYDMGVRKFIEIGPGKTLSGLIKRSIPDPVVLNVENISGLELLRDNDF
ncbi:MAG: ACP S-malonyltransferase [Thermodesulfobacteriota bacterium]